MATKKKPNNKTKEKKEMTKEPVNNLFKKKEVDKTEMESKLDQSNLIPIDGEELKLNGDLNPLKTKEEEEEEAVTFNEGVDYETIEDREVEDREEVLNGMHDFVEKLQEQIINITQIAYSKLGIDNKSIEKTKSLLKEKMELMDIDSLQEIIQQELDSVEVEEAKLTSAIYDLESGKPSPHIVEEVDQPQKGKLTYEEMVKFGATWNGTTYQ